MDMSVAIVCMVNQTAIKKYSVSFESNLTQLTEKNYEDVCLFKQVAGSKSFVSIKILISKDNCLKHEIYSKDGPFAWDKKIQGLILSSYFYGYLTTQVFNPYLFSFYFT